MMIRDGKHFFVVGILSACSAAGGGIPDGPSGGGGLEGGTSDAGDGSGGMIDVPDASKDVHGEFEVCEALKKLADRVPLTLYVLFDRSASMSEGSKWADARKGFAAFVQDAASDELALGLVFFPREPLLENEPACSFANYEQPHVAFGVLPAHAQELLDGIDATTASGSGTPMYPGIGGALNRLIVRRNEAIAQGRVENFAVLLVTDGEPQAPPASCSKNPLDLGNIAQLAKNGIDKFGIRTYVVGLPGTNPAFAGTVAAAGGGQAIQVSQTDIAESFRSALASVRGEALGCAFPLPPQTGNYTTDHVNVTYQSGPPQNTTLEALKSEDCSYPMGWRYDDESKPSKVELCADLCDAVKADGLAKIEIELGCPTRVK